MSARVSMMVSICVHTLMYVLLFNHRYRRFAVFIIAPLDPERGDLHVAPGLNASSPAKTVSSGN